MDLRLVLEQFQDYLAPKLDTYEQAIYLYILRHSRLQGKKVATIGFKSARRRMAFGIGEKGKPMSESTCYTKIRSLESKGCLVVIGSERDGTRVRLNLPSEIDRLIPPREVPSALALEEMDFFNVAENRALILKREGHRCFYCLRKLDESNYVIEHAVSRPQGDNGYRNVVAACLNCNNRKGGLAAEDFLRALYRDGYLGDKDFDVRLRALSALKSGELKPDVRGA